MQYLLDEYAFDTELRRGSDIISVTPKVFGPLEYLIGNGDQQGRPYRRHLEWSHCLGCRDAMRSETRARSST